MDELLPILTRYQGYGIIAFAVTVFATPVAARLAQRFGVMDIPDKLLKPHARPVPYLGGTAICLGWTVAISTAMALGVVDGRIMLPILLGGVAMSLLGLADDVRGLSPKLRLLIGATVIGAVLVLTGAGSQLVFSLLRPAGIELPSAVAIPLSYAISIFIVLGACNSTNLIDGLDGLCTGVTGIITFSFFLLAAMLAIYKVDQPGHAVRLVLAVGMCGAALGFLPMNFNPAKIFMGDAGSVLLGYSCGMLILLFAEWGIVRWVIGALVIFALPVFDTALAMFRRWRSGRSIFAGDRSHFYDQLVQRGLSVRQTVLVCYALTVFFATAGLLVMWLRTLYAIALYVTLCLLILVIAWRSGLTHPERVAATKEMATSKELPR